MRAVVRAVDDPGPAPGQRRRRSTRSSGPTPASRPARPPPAGDDAEVHRSPLPARPSRGTRRAAERDAHGGRPDRSRRGPEPIPRPGPRPGGRRSKTCTGPSSPARNSCSIIESSKLSSNRLRSMVAAILESSAANRWRWSADEPRRRAGRRASARDVAPILVRKCLGCHNAKKAEGGLNMATFAALRQGGKTAGDAILEPGDPDSSYLIESVRRETARRMPYKQPAARTPGRSPPSTRWVKRGGEVRRAVRAETPIASLVDPLAGLPKDPAQGQPARGGECPGVSARGQAPGGRARAGVSSSTMWPTGKPAADAGRPSGADHGPGIHARRPGADRRRRPAGHVRSITAWDVASGPATTSVRGHTDSILGAADLARRHDAGHGGYDRQVMIWDLGQGHGRARPSRSTPTRSTAWRSRPTASSWPRAGPTGRSSSGTGATGRRIATLSDATGELYAVAFSPDGTRVLAAGVDRSIRAWRLDEHAGRPGALGLRPRRADRPAGPVSPTARRWPRAARTAG